MGKPARVAVALLTCNRETYTRRTVDAFRAWNPTLERLELLHGDDASTTPENAEIATAGGFQTVIATRSRIGSNALRGMVIAAALRRAEWVLVLENDIETVRPFPWALFDRVRADRKPIECLRLYGRYKSDGVDPCLTVNKWTGDEVTWKRWRYELEPVEIGVVHWSPQPSVTHRRILEAVHYEDKRPRFRTVRVLDNVTRHIGAERTGEP